MGAVVLSLLLLLALGSASAAPLPVCVYEDRPAALTGYEDWPFTLLDTLYRLPESYAPDDLMPVSEAGVGTDEMTVRSLVMPALQALLAEAEAAGIGLEVQSAYRSYSYQVTTFDYWVAQDGLEVALKTSARPGHSEHQLGTALDFRSADGPPAWELDDWRDTLEGTWLAENAPRFGFVMSYPEGKEDVTCYSYEPWHYRYVGREVAAEVQKSGLTLREWLWQQ
jgi:D-alanyl-D-alanine carboxypeptidase